MSLGDALRRLVEAGELDLPPPASGATADRHRRLVEVAGDDLPLARLAEAHVDAVAILHEAGRNAAPGVLYGVWASEDPSTALSIEPSPDGRAGAVLQGTKNFCTGGGIVDRALITVRTDADAPLLLDVDVDTTTRGSVRFDASRWITAAFEATSTAVATFDGHRLDHDAQVGPPGWYLDRVGFWHGACGPAACWAGGAIGLVEWAGGSAARGKPDPHRDAHLGAITALAWSMSAALEQAGHEIDQSPSDREQAMRRALVVRHLVERAATEIIDRIGRMMGPRPFAFDQTTSRRLAEVQLYIRQCHAERDLAALGESVRDQANRMDDLPPDGR